jgi:hypothetical protein
MKRAAALWPALTAWQNLLESAHAAARGKRRRPDVARFLFRLEPNVCALQRALLDGSWRPGPYRAFWIHDPKPRLISAAPFPDRVVHHALTRTLEAVFEPRFTDASFASRAGFGQHRALEQARAACEKFPYVLKCDIRKYFPSIDHSAKPTPPAIPPPPVVPDRYRSRRSESQAQRACSASHKPTDAAANSGVPGYTGRVTRAKIVQRCLTNLTYDLHLLLRRLHERKRGAPYRNPNIYDVHRRIVRWFAAFAGLVGAGITPSEMPIRIHIPQGIIQPIRIHVPTLRIAHTLPRQRIVRPTEPTLRPTVIPRHKIIQTVSGSLSYPVNFPLTTSGFPGNDAAKWKQELLRPPISAGISSPNGR